MLARSTPLLGTGEKKMGTEILLPKVVAAAVTALGMYWMDLDVGIHTLLMFMMADLVTGAIASIIQGKFVMRQLWYGVLRKCGALLMLACVHAVEPMLVVQAHLEDYFANVLVVYEFGSVVDNVAAAGGLPSPVMLVLNKIRDALVSSIPGLGDQLAKVDQSKPQAATQPTQSVPPQQG